MPIQLVVGLGNPGDQYAETRHNAGFQVVDALAREHSSGAWQAGLQSLICTLDRIEPRSQPELLRGGENASTSICLPPLRLAKPQTYMNRSASAVVAVTEAFAIAPEEMLVVVDDIDLPLGRLRLRPSGGAGSHNGLRDIVEAVGTSFPRLRIGVRGEAPWDDLADYVLSPFTSDEQEQLNAVIERATEAVLATVRQGLAPAMNQFNRAAPEADG